MARYDDGVLSQLKALADLAYRHEAWWKTGEMQPLGPASEEAVAHFSDSLPVRLPPSYRSFLAHHDGCLGFWPNFVLLGTSVVTRKVVDAAVEDARVTMNEYVAPDGGAVTPERIAAFETPTDVTEKLYLPVHTVFGTNEGGEFFVFNDRVRRGEEYEVVHYTYDGGIYYRYDDFPAFLAATLDELKTRARDKKYR